MSSPEKGRHPTKRENCLLCDEEVQRAIETLVLRLSDDYFRHGICACSACSRCLGRRTAIDLHCQLKSIRDFLTVVRDGLDKLQEEDREQ